MKKNILLIVIITILAIYSGVITCYYCKYHKQIKDLESYYESDLGKQELKVIEEFHEKRHQDKFNQPYDVNKYNEWINLLSKTGINLNTPNNFEVLELYYYKENNAEDYNAIFKAVYKINEKQEYVDFTNNLFNSLKEKYEIIESFNNEYNEEINQGYYEINNFDESKYNNIYFDYPTGVNTSSKVKIKINYDDNKIITLEVNHF